MCFILNNRPEIWDRIQNMGAKSELKPLGKILLAIVKVLAEKYIVVIKLWIMSTLYIHKHYVSGKL